MTIDTNKAREIAAVLQSRAERSVMASSTAEDIREAAALLLALADAHDRMAKDAARYRWLRDVKCNSISAERDPHACNYCTATEWIEDYCPDWFAGVSQDVLNEMKTTNTIWKLQIYPDTPVGFYDYFGATFDAAIDAAMGADNG